MSDPSASLTEKRYRAGHVSRAAAIAAAGRLLADSDRACAQMTPREQAEAAWTPTSPYSVDELEAQIRADRELGGEEDQLTPSE